MSSALANALANQRRLVLPVASGGEAGAAPRLAPENEARRIADLPWVDYSDEEIRTAAVAWATERWRKTQGIVVIAEHPEEEVDKEADYILADLRCKRDHVEINGRIRKNKKEKRLEPPTPCPACGGERFNFFRFKPIQGLALLVAHLQGGLLGPIGTGHGKEMLSRLAAEAMGARKPLLLLPPSMRDTYARNTAMYGQSFKLPGNLRVMAYSQLSTASSTNILDALAPDVIVADEAHNLRHPESARVRRLIRYLRSRPDTKVVLLSGTLTAKSLNDYAHLAEWALKGGSPVPRPKFFPVLQSFCNILDAKPTRKDGDSRFVAEARPSDFATFSPLFRDWKDHEGALDDGTNPRVAKARELFQDRLVHTPGVVATDTASVGASLLLIRRPVVVPATILAHLAELELSWQRPDGEELVLAIDKWRCGRQLSQGFYYRWKWPNGGPDEQDKAWLRTRAAWHREVRDVCKSNLPSLDSPMLVTMAARRQQRGEQHAVEPCPQLATYIADVGNEESRDMYGNPYTWQDAQADYAKALNTWEERRRRPVVKLPDALMEALKEWEPHAARRWHGKPTPPTETVWLDRFLLDDALAWFAEHPRGLLWYADHAIGDGLAERGIKVYGAGTNPEELEGRTGAALSIHVHKDGKNLQKHHENLYMDVSPSGTVMEQSLSRTHRSGQESDEVLAWYYAHTEPALNALASCCNDAAYIQGTMRTPQRLCYAIWTEEE